MTTIINFDEIPTDNNGKYYYSQCDTFWRKEIDYQYKIQLQNDNKLYYHRIILFADTPFYFESPKQIVSRQEALQICLNDLKYFTSYESLNEIIEEAIQCGSYINENISNGWTYFNHTF